MVFVKIPVNGKGQIVIPKAIRETYGISPGSDIWLGEKEGDIILRKTMGTQQFLKELESFPKSKTGKIDSDALYADEMKRR